MGGLGENIGWKLKIALIVKVEVIPDQKIFSNQKALSFRFNVIGLSVCVPFVENVFGVCLL